MKTWCVGKRGNFSCCFLWGRDDSWALTCSVKAASPGRQLRLWRHLSWTGRRRKTWLLPRVLQAPRKGPGGKVQMGCFCSRRSTGENRGIAVRKDRKR